MTSPRTPVHITRIIQRTELSIPRLFESFATQTSMAMLIATKATKMKTIKPIIPEHAAQPAAAPASSLCSTMKLAASALYIPSPFCVPGLAVIRLGKTVKLDEVPEGTKDDLGMQ